MPLTPVEREKIKDSRQKIESAARTLKGVPAEKIRAFDDLEECLEEAEQSLNEALGSDSPESAKN
jgi:hypothetical protein